SSSRSSSASSGPLANRGEDDDESPAPRAADRGAYNPEDYRDVSASHPEFAGAVRLHQALHAAAHRAGPLRLKPFIPDFIRRPCGRHRRLHARVPRPDSKPDQLGLRMLDEPCASQSDPPCWTCSCALSASCWCPRRRRCPGLRKRRNWNPHAIEKMDLQPSRSCTRHQQPPTLMSEWRPRVRSCLGGRLPTSANLECDLPAFCDICLSRLLDIPVLQVRVQSLHVLFTLYFDLRNSPSKLPQPGEGNRLEQPR
uniref:Intraflagellar transport protein 46 homolog n=1 Tax=Macrostomum lignano TaxID=282301 RepID=A0A1I8FGF8_9PLAT